jgi:uncharacterized membrane-anchored protein
MKQWIKRITGLAEIEENIKLLEEKKAKELEELAEIETQRKEQEEKAALAKLSPKERADRKQEPWVSVLDTHVSKDNIRNGFFELDWNKYFIQELIQNGYGTDADPEEEIVDRWFREIVFNMFAEEGLDTQRGSGYINVVPISKGKSEVS